MKVTLAPLPPPACARVCTKSKMLKKEKERNFQRLLLRSGRTESKVKDGKKSEGDYRVKNTFSE